MKVKLYLHLCEPRRAYSNIMFDKSYPMRAGKFPPAHPCADEQTPTTFGPAAPSQTGIGKFRALGYFASCFPEGDGISFKELTPKTPEQISADVVACFAFELGRVDVYR